MKLVVGCDLEDFRRYSKKDGVRADVVVLEKHIFRDTSSIIVFRKDHEIIGHAIWHESNTEEHRKGDPRDEEDKEVLERLLGGKREFVELHELWLIEKYRGRGYGKQFFEFFERFIKNKGYDSIVFYANHPAAITICRQRKYKEGGYLKGVAEYVFYLPLKKKTRKQHLFDLP